MRQNTGLRHPEKTYKDLDWAAVAELIAVRCGTKRGAQRARGWPLCGSLEEAREVRNEIQEARQLGAEGTPLSIGVDLELEEHLDRLSRSGILEGEVLLEVAGMLSFGATLRRKRLSEKESFPLLAKRTGRLKALEDISGPITDSFMPSGELRDEASAELGSLRKRAKSLRDEIVARLESMIEEPRVEKLLQDKYYTLREGRYVLPVKVESQHLLPGIVHGRSNTEATVYLEPAEITELGNKLKMAFADVEIEEHRVLAELSLLVREEIPSIRGNIEVLVGIDGISAAGQLAEDLDGIAPELDKRGALHLLEARHPLMVANREKVVANDFELDEGVSLVVTGPNAGGKTVALKTVGLLCMMAQAGLHPPCGKGSVLPFYQGVFTSIGDDQDISAKLSTFTAHMSNLNRILEKGRDGDLVLLDEVAVGTEPTQGAALARAVLEQMVSSGVQVLVTTHYTGLKAIAAEDKRFTNAAMEFDAEGQRPTYRLASGMLGRSSALSVARSLGLPDAVLSRAEELMGGQQSRLEGLMVEVERRHEALGGELERAREARQEAEKLKEQLKKKEKSLREELRDLKRSTYDESVLELRSLRDEIARVRKTLKKGPKSERGAQRAQKKAAEVAKRLGDLSPTPEGIEGRRPEKGDLKVGSQVVVKSMGAKGEVVDLDSKGRPTVQVGAVKLRLKPNEVLLDDSVAASRGKKNKSRGGKAGGEAKKGGHGGIAIWGAGSGKKKNKRRQLESRDSQDPVILVRDSANTLDLRGMRVDESRDEIDRFVDRMFTQNREGFLVIHGYGTGALQKAVREHLALHPLVGRYRPGRKEEGGEGVTVAFLEG